MRSTLPKKHSILVNLACLAIVLASVKMADGIFSPILTSIFLSFIFHPVQATMNKVRRLRKVSLAIVSVIMLTCILALISVITHSLHELSASLPAYSEKLTVLAKAANDVLARYQIQVNLLDTLHSFDSSTLPIMTIASKAGNVTNYLLMVTIITLFILSEVDAMKEKIRLHIHARHIESIEQFTRSMNSYLITKTMISLIKGCLIAGMLLMIGNDFYMVVGLIVFCLNFIPNIGPFLSAIPGIVTTLLQLGINEVVIVAAAYLVINALIGNYIEPKLFGRKLGLTPLVVFVSLIFWSWLLGPIGLILSVPLTMAIKILLETSKRGKRIALFISA